MKFIDFFAGIGGIRMGFEQEGFECVGYCEIDQFARKSYEAIYETKDEWKSTDITTATAAEMPEADIWCGGFPCQSFSIAGKRRGFQDTRGTLIYEVLRLAAERKPKVLLLENVKGLLNHDNGRTFGVILSVLGELGYDAEWQLFNTKNFGPPQNRERVFIAAYLRGSSRPKIFPTSMEIKNNAGGIPSVTHGFQGVLIKKQKIIREQDISSCILAGYRSCFMSRQGSTGVTDWKSIRRFTALECWRLQGFPDWAYYKALAAGVSETQLYKQAGNGVSVPVARAIAKKIKQNVY